MGLLLQPTLLGRPVKMIDRPLHVVSLYFQRPLKKLNQPKCTLSPAIPLFQDMQGRYSSSSVFFQQHLFWRLGVPRKKDLKAFILINETPPCIVIYERRVTCHAFRTNKVSDQRITWEYNCLSFSPPFSLVPQLLSYHPLSSLYCSKILIRLRGGPSDFQFLKSKN